MIRDDLLVIRTLTADRDAEKVMDLLRRAADYVELETGKGPGPGTLEDFFEGTPPGLDPAASLRLGLFRAGRLEGISEMAFGYPKERDAYIGLMLFDAACRGAGLGRRMLAYLVEAARVRGALRMLVAVLEENPRGRAFWEREGFMLERLFPAGPIGRKMHVRYRMERLIATERREA